MTLAVTIINDSSLVVECRNKNILIKIVPDIVTRNKYKIIQPFTPILCISLNYYYQSIFEIVYVYVDCSYTTRNPSDRNKNIRY